MKDRLIVWYNKADSIITAFTDIETAAAVTGIHKNIIWRNLQGLMNDAPGGTKFRYEVKASDLRKRNREEKRKKEQEKANKLLRKFEGK